MKGNNPMISIFMVIFGQECFYDFNSAALEHFKGMPFKINNNVKSNVVRVWQKIKMQKDTGIHMLKYELFSIATIINGVYLMFLLLGIVFFIMFDPTMCYRYMIDE
jgi:hypothetical protein